MSTEPTALPAAIVSAIDDYGVVCANVAKKRTSPECENWAREKLEDAIRSHLAAPTVVRAGGGVTTERLRELRAECEQRRDEAQASANYHEGSGNDARWQGEADFFAAIRDIIDTAALAAPASAPGGGEKVHEQEPNDTTRLDWWEKNYNDGPSLGFFTDGVLGLGRGHIVETKWTVKGKACATLRDAIDAAMSKEVPHA